jgi:hypothetical protein
MLGTRGVVITPDSGYAKEMVKHEAYHTQYGPPQRPYVFREFPKRLYKAEQVSGKGIQIVDAQTAEDDLQERNLLSRGFHFGQDTAIEAVQREHTEHGRLAAEREYALRHGKHSERAVSEVRAAEEAHGARHLPSVPETPIKRRTRGPNKPKASATT